MAIQNVSDSQKIDYLWKKLGYGAAKTDISGNIDATQEPYASPLQIRADKIMQQSALIPSIIPGSNTSVVSVYTTSLPIQCISNAGIPTPTLTWLTGVTYWVPPEFGSTYQVKVYIAPAGNAAAVLTRGTQVFATGSGNNDQWFFDYQSGILQFNGNNTPYNTSNQPISFTGNAVYISGAVYSGAFGLPSTIGNLTVSNTTIISPGNISFSSTSGYIYAGGAIIANVANPINSQDVVTVANLLSTVGNISAITGNLTIGGNLVVTGNLVVLGNLTQMNIEVINTTEYISSTGNLVINNTAPSTSTTTGVITTLGGIGIGGNINAGGNISAPYFIGSGQFITGLPVAYSNVNVKAYTETMGFQNFGNVNVKAYTESMGFQNFGNVNVKAYTETMGFQNFGNVNVKAYTETMGFQNFGNANVVAYTQTQAFTNYSNVNVAAYTQTQSFTNYSNVNVASYINTMGYANYSNVNVKAYTESMGFANYGNVNVISYLAGNITTGNINSAGVINFTNSTNAIGIASGGALTVAGGASFGKDVYVGGNLYVANIIGVQANVITVQDPLLYLSPDHTFPYNYDIGFYSAFTGPGLSTLANVYQHTGIIRDYHNNAWTFASNIAEPGGSILIIDNNTVYDPIIAGNLALQNSIAAINNSTGALIVVGGAGIGGSLYARDLQNTAIGNVVPNSGTFTTVTTGLVSSGFVGNAGTVFTGTSLNASGNVISAGAIHNALTVNGNGTFTGYVNTTGNVLATSFVGSGALLTALPGYAYSNVNVTAYLAGNVTVGNLTSVGNVTAAYYLGAGANTTIIAGAYTSTFNNQGNVILPNVYVSGNVTAGYFIGNGSQLTGLPAQYSNVQVATYLPGYNGAIGASNVTISGNLVLNNTSNILISGNAGLNGQFLTSTGNGIQWSTITLSASQISAGGSNVTVTNTYVNVAINGSNIASFSNSGLNVTSISAIPGANITLNTTSGGIVQVTGNGALGIPYGNTYTRPGNPTTGYTRYNTDIPGIETWSGTAWVAPGTATILSQMIYPDGASNVFTLTSNATTNGVLVSINGTLQQPGAAYNVANTSITFSEVPLTSDQIEVRYMVQGTSVISASQLQFGNTTSVVLDAANITVTSQNINQSGNLSVQANITHGTLQSGVTTIPTSANVIYVAKNGNDSWNGTINAPFLTIKAGLAAAANITSSTGVSVQVAPGYYTEANPITIPPKVSLMGDNLRNVTVVPQTPASDLFYVTNGCYVWGITIKDYLANGFSYNSSTSSQNVFVSPYIQNLTSSTTTGTAVMVDGAFTSNASTKAMIVGFFTIINQGGVGVRLQNSAYSQLVNIYTIAANVGVWAQSGSFCTLNGSDNSIGNIGLRADGYGPLLSTGQTVGYSLNGQFVLNNLTQPPHVNQVMLINGDSNFYSIDTITKIDAITYQVNIQEVYSGNLAPSSNISFYQRSQVVASAHTFEYVGAGTVPANALPQYGGLPDSTKNVVMTNGGRVTYTATDEKGNFFIGSNLVINQGTGTISGDSFNRSLFQIMTPYILALEGTI